MFKHEKYILLNDTLQSQVENIYNWVLSYKKQTNIDQINANLPFIITATTCADLNIEVNPTVINSTSSAYTISLLKENYIYNLGEITSLTITEVADLNKESTIYFTSGTTATTISIPSTLTNLGDAPTLTTSGGINTGTCDASKSYIISVLNNIAIWKEY